MNGMRMRTLGAVSDADFEKLRRYRRMQGVALWLLIGMAVIFAVSFSLQDTIPAFAYVRAAAEGGMVGAIADWFAVTALFRHPMRLPIPHTNLIANKKHDIGDGLGSFIEENFLADDVVHDRLSRISGARIAGTWLVEREHAEQVTDFLAQAGQSALTVLADRDVQEVIEDLVRTHVVNPEWSPTTGRIAEQLLAAGHHHTLLDLAAERFEAWLVANPDSFERIVSSRIPAWLSFVNRAVDKRAHSEALKFVRSVRERADHPFRAAVDDFLGTLAEDLQTRHDVRRRLEGFKHEVFDSPRIRAIAEHSWGSARSALDSMLRDPHSEFRRRLTTALQDFGAKLCEDSTLQFKIDVWVMTAVEHLVRTYRHDLANVVAETVHRWDATEAAEKIELQIGKDLQFIRINGTIIGSLAGLTIFSVATFIQTVLAR